MTLVIHPESLERVRNCAVTGEALAEMFLAMLPAAHVGCTELTLHWTDESTPDSEDELIPTLTLSLVRRRIAVNEPQETDSAT